MPKAKPKAKDKARGRSHTNKHVPPPSQPYTYTILIATPRFAPATFLAQARQSSPPPLFTGEEANFLNKDKRTQRVWKNVLVLPASAEVPQFLGKKRFRQRWSFTVTSETPFLETDAVRTVQPGLQGGAVAVDVEVPQDLANAAKRLQPAQRKAKSESALYVLSFAKFEHDSPNAYGAYAHRLAAAQKDSDGDVHMHVSGRVSDMSPMQTFNDAGAPKKDYEADAADAFALLSFPSALHYAAFRRRFAEAAHAGDGVGRLEESSILTLAVDLDDGRVKKTRVRRKRVFGTPQPFVWESGGVRSVHPVGSELW